MRSQYQFRRRQYQIGTDVFLSSPSRSRRCSVKRTAKRLSKRDRLGLSYDCRHKRRFAPMFRLGCDTVFTQHFETSAPTSSQHDAAVSRAASPSGPKFSGRMSNPRTSQETGTMSAAVGSNRSHNILCMFLHPVRTPGPRSEDIRHRFDRGAESFDLRLRTS